MRRVTPSSDSRSTTATARRSGGSSTPGPTTAAGSSRWWSCASSRFGERRMLPIESRSPPGARRSTRVLHARCRSRTRRSAGEGVHRADDPYRALAYWRWEEPGGVDMVTAAMAPQLWLLRHGEAVPHDSKPDADRELTARGERQAIAAGEAPRPARRRVRRLLHEPEGPRARHRAARLPGAEHRAGRGRLARRRLRPRRRARAAARPRRRRARPGRRARSVVLAGRATTSPAAGWTSRRAASRRSASSAAIGELLVLLRPRELESLARS